MNEMTDEELALQYINGVNKAFDILLERNQSKIFAYILFVVHERELANDLFQETFVKVITKLQQHRYEPSGKFAAWVMRIAHNVVMDWYRNRKADNIVETSDDNELTNINNARLSVTNIENEKVNSQILCDVKNVMESLPPTQREVVYMRFYQEIPFKEIAELTGVSINTSLGRMRYAILNMRRMVKEHNISLRME